MRTNTKNVKELLRLVRCPKCGGDLTLSNKFLVGDWPECVSCSSVFVLHVVVNNQKERKPEKVILTDFVATKKAEEGLTYYKLGKTWNLPVEQPQNNEK